jgi:cytosolic carboxypeptidase protein 5
LRSPVFSLKNEQAKCLRNNFVFKIIPMLNPDGVSRGYYRLDTKGFNLNRFYLNPSRQEHPTIHATKALVTQHATVYKDLMMFVDFHAHASKKSGFMFGNCLQNKEAQADNITFAKLVAMNCLNFDMTECNFSDRIMSVKDRNGQSREGSSRVAIN